MLKASFTQMIDKTLMEKIHLGTAEVLEKCGVNFEHDAALAIFKKAGAVVDGRNVKIPIDMFEKAMSNTPKTITMTGLDPSKSILIGEGQDRVHADPNFGSVNVYEEGKGHRLAERYDLINILKILEASSMCDVAGGIPADPHDAPEHGRSQFFAREILRHTTKPFRNFVATKEDLYDFYNMVDIIKGKGFTDEHTCMITAINPTSPLIYDSKSAQTLIASAEKHQAICCLTCAISGFTSPMNMLGTTVMQQAEMLAGNILMQLVNPNAPFLLGPASARPDMRTGLYANASPESSLLNLASIQLGREYYQIPTRVMAGLSDSKCIDAQAGLETMQTLLFAFMSGVHMVHGSFACLDSFKSTSLEYIIIAEEIFSRALRFMEGIREPDMDLSVSEIISTNVHGNYITNENTLNNCQDVWSPSVSVTSPFEVWQEEGSLSIAERAKKRYQETLMTCPDTVIDKEQDEALCAYIKQRGFDI